MKVYVVAKGKHPGIYFTWDQCKAETHKVKGAIFKSFDSIDAAEDFYKQHNSGQLPKNKSYRNADAPKIAQSNAIYKKIDTCILCGKPMHVRHRKQGPSQADEGICGKCHKILNAFKQLNPTTNTHEPYTPDEIAWVIYTFKCDDVWLFLARNPAAGKQARLKTHDGFMRTGLKIRKAHNQRINNPMECPQWLRAKLGHERTFIKMTGDPRDPLVLYHCNICNKDYAAHYSTLKKHKGHDCTKLNTINAIVHSDGRISSGEACIKEYLQRQNIPHLTQHATLRCINPSTGRQLPYDFELCAQKIILEIQGEQHRSFIPWFHVDEAGFEYQQQKDAYKKQFAIDHGYQVIEIWYEDIKSGKYKTLLDNLLK